MILKRMLGTSRGTPLKSWGDGQDLCIPILTYVFGEAQVGGTAAVVSLARLRQEITGLRRTGRCSWRGFARNAATSWGTRSVSFIAVEGGVMHLSNTWWTSTPGAGLLPGCDTVMASQFVTERRG